MKKKLKFSYPFWQWGGLGFYNCYAGVFMYLSCMADENIKCMLREAKSAIIAADVQKK
jgi:hypothetical protein